MTKIMAKVQEKRKKLCYVFMDLEKAYDCVPREVARRALRKLMVPEWFVNTMIAMYEHVWMVVRTQLWTAKVLVLMLVGTGQFWVHCCS